MSVSSRHLILRSFQTTRSLLFPLGIQKWLTWLAILFLCGHLSGLGSVFSHVKESAFVFYKQMIERAYPNEPIEMENALKDNHPLSWPDLKTELKKLFANPHSIPITSSVAALFFLLVVYVLKCWLNARFDFVLIDAVCQKKPRLLTPFFAYSGISRSLFWWNMVM